MLKKNLDQVLSCLKTPTPVRLVLTESDHGSG